MQKLFVFFIGLIIYGSLFPFTFSFNNGAAERWDILFHSFHPFTSLGDILGNIVLFIPFGYLGLEALSPTRFGKPPTGKIILYGLILALLIQIIQVYVPFRSPAIADVYWNGVGILLGIMSAQVIKRFFPKLSLSHATNIPAILALFWLLYLLFPFVPTLDFQEIKNSIKPLILSPVFHGDDFLIAVTGWLLFAHFTKDLFHQVLLNRHRLLLCGILSLLIRPIILSNYVYLSDAAAVFAAILIWPLLEKNKLNNSKILTYIMVMAILIYAIGSLDFSPHNSGFSWIPFSGFLEGSLFENTRSLFFKIFLYGSMIWLVRTGWPYLRLQSLWVFLFILFLEIIQIFMKSHTAEITDPLLILLLAPLIQAKIKTLSPQVSGPKDNFLTNNIKLQTPIKQILLLIGSIIFIAFIISTIIRLPGVPYNVREIFGTGGSLADILFFTSFILWFGMSVPIISKMLLKQPNYHFIFFPFWVIASMMVSFLFLTNGVSGETLSDVLGSMNTYRDVTQNNMWGDFGLLLSKVIPLPDLWVKTERIIRFLALFSPIIFISCLFYHAADLVKKYNLHRFTSQYRLLILSLPLNIAYMLPWLYLCKLITFDHPSTDNLSELIAQNGVMGFGGGSYLYLLLILLSLNCVWIIQSQSTVIFRILAFLMATVLGWFLFNLGIETEIKKYGKTFSGITFLLGPDRQTSLSEIQLFVRWIILYTSSVTILTWGMKFNILSLLVSKNKIKNIQVKNG